MLEKIICVNLNNIDHHLSKTNYDKKVLKIMHIILCAIHSWFYGRENDLCMSLLFLLQ